MHNVSQTYKDIIKTSYRHDTALQIGRSDAVSIMTDAQLRAKGPVYREDSLFSIKTSANVFSNNAPAVGCCVAKTITVRILEPSTPIPRQARLVPFSRVANDRAVSEWIPKGVFYLDTRKRSNGNSDHPVLELTGYDAMMKTEQLYTDTALGDSATDIAVVREIAQKIGVEVDSRTVALMTGGYTVKLSPDYTYREILGFIAAMYGGNFVMSDTGKLLLLPLKGGS